MEENIQNNPSVTNSKKLKFSTMYVGLGLAVTLVVGIMIGYLLKSISTQSDKNEMHPIVIQPTITPRISNDPKLLENPIAILESPIFTEWSGSVEGKVVAKDATSFTLEKNSMRLQIYLQQSLTGFYKEGLTSSSPSKISFEFINIGDTLRGAVTISRLTMDNNATHHVFANVFTVINENTTR